MKLIKSNLICETSLFVPDTGKTQEFRGLIPSMCSDLELCLRSYVCTMYIYDWNIIEVNK